MPSFSRIPFALLVPAIVLLTLALTGGSLEPPRLADSAALTWRPLHRHEGKARGIRGLGVVVTGVSRDGSRIYATSPPQSFRSDDGGRSWTEIAELKGARDIAFGNGGVILAAGGTPVGRDGGLIHRSADGGASWTKIRTVADDAIVAVYVNGRDAFAVGGSAVLQSRDAGETWTRVDAPKVHYLDVEARGPIVLAVGGTGLVTRSADGGETWRHQWLPTRAVLQAVAFADERTAVISTSDGTLLRSTDAGQSWKAVDSPARARLYGIAFDEKGHGLAVGFWGEAVRSTDAGATWQRERSGTHLHLVDVELDPTGGFLVTGTRESVFSVTSGGAR